MPDLVIGVNSPYDNQVRVLNKVNQWLEAGVREVWVIDPDEQAVLIYNKPGQYTVLNRDDEIYSTDILPGFKYKVNKIFDLTL